MHTALEEVKLGKKQKTEKQASDFHYIPKCAFQGPLHTNILEVGGIMKVVCKLNTVHEFVENLKEKEEG